MREPDHGTIVAPLSVAFGYVVIGLSSAQLVRPLYAGELLWMPGALALGVAIVYGRRALLGVLPGSIALTLILGFSPLSALIAGVASTIGTWLGASVAPAAWRERPALRSLGDARTLWRVAATTSLVTAGIVSLSPDHLGGGLASVVAYASEFFLADVLGVLLLLPVVLAVLGPKDRSERTGSTVEFIGVLALLVMGTALNYAVRVPILLETALPFLLGPLLLVLVLRFGWREVTFAVLLMAPIAFASASHGVEPFAGDDIVEARLLLQFVFIGAAMMSQVIVTLMGERRGIIAELQSSRVDLEERVRARTAELEDANRVLASEMTERRRAEAQLLEHRSSLERVVRERTVELEDANRQLISALRAKSQFLANMSHELRTPLNSIIGFSDILVYGMAGELTEEQLRQIRMVNSSGKHLLNLVNDVLDVTKIDAGAVQATPEPFVLGPVIAQSIDSMSVLAAEKGLTLQARCPDDLEVCADKTKFQQILLNLISNAIKFTPTGRVDVVASRIDDRLVVKVVDTGIGIAPEELPRVFEQFHQSRSVEAGKPVGTGLGLAISQRLARMLGGDLTGESEPGRGSTFTLTLPVMCEESSTGVSLVSAES